jgi:hypothetical protein
LKKEWNVLETECHSLKKENVLLSSELQRQEKELHKYVRVFFFSFKIFTLNFYQLNLILILKYFLGGKCSARLWLFGILTMLNKYLIMLPTSSYITLPFGLLVEHRFTNAPCPTKAFSKWWMFIIVVEFTP